MSGLKIGVVGATGLVGQELVSILEQSELEVSGIKFFASERSSGTFLSFRNQNYPTTELRENDAPDLDYMFFCTCPRISAKFIPIFSERGIICIDNSSKYRMQADVPLVVPEINAHALKGHGNIIANPNCSTIIALMALAPLHNAFELSGFCVSTYQAVSGVGRSGVSALMDDLAGEHGTSMATFGQQIAFNALPQIGKIDETGYSFEEKKMCDESRKILNRNELRISAMCVRIAVMRAHSMAIFASFKKQIDPVQAENVLKQDKNIVFHGDGSFPCPIDVDGKNICEVGRLRMDSFIENGLSMWVVGDQVRKGAALNAFQIMLALENQG
ncbi:MAG: aspartate-semialdehyde dehydrogenase [Puniceicoccales bacterium]|jgi:aspartate-semialdehyde dehydrogenase|nr:aspartate-semialdehyde dehydrogenase [Puniceicoccales bacterium]